MNNRLFSFNINLPVIFKFLKKKLLMIFLITVIVGSLGYVIIDSLVTEKYISTINLSVIPNENIANNFSTRRMSSSLVSYTNVLNRDVVKKKVCEDMGVSELPGTIEASYIFESNIVEVKCSSNSLKTSFLMMKSFRKIYQDVCFNFNGGYLIKDLGKDRVEFITRSDSRSILMTIILSLLVFVGGVAWAVFYKIFEGTIQDLKQAKKEIDTKFIGLICHEKKKKNMLMNSPLVSFSYVESIKKIATKIIYKSLKNNYKTIVVTSVLENEGKSTTIANLALAMAEQGKKVLLIDGDLRKPSQYKLFEKQNTLNIVQYLEGKGKIQDYIEHDNDKNLWFAFSKQSRDNADELLESEKMKYFINQMKEEMDFILIDTAPAGITRDVEALSEMVDAAILVVRQEKSKIVMINDTINDLCETGIEMLGFVFNDATEKRGYVESYHQYYKKDIQLENTYGE